MKKLIPFFSVFVFVLIPFLGQAQDTVSVKDLNTYPQPLTEYSQAAVSGHPLVGQKVTYTGVIVSNPKSSGNSTPRDNSGDDGIIDDISRMHLFITDTAAVTQGRAGMSIQIVENDYELLENFKRGDVVTFVGELTFYSSNNNETTVAQMTADQAALKGSVYLNFPQYAELLNPVEVTVDELMKSNPDGTFEVNIENYTKYNGAYVKITDATVSNVSISSRPNWALNENGSKIYISDISLRYRNDRTAGYLPSWNYRRFNGLGNNEDGEFVPPVAGAVVNVSGFLSLNDFNNDGHFPNDKSAFKINPFEDGVQWQEDINNAGQYVRCVDGETCQGEAFSWPNDVEIVGLPPFFSNVAQSDSSVTPADAITITSDIEANGAATVASAILIYTVGTEADTVAMTNTTGNTYSADLPTFDNFTSVSFHLEATDSDGITGRAPLSGSYGFFVQDGAINSISLIQKTSNEGAGASPLAGKGVKAVDISGIIVSDDSDGPIIIQEAAAAWSGVFLEKTAATKALAKGDSVTITSAAVTEVEIGGTITLTQLTDLEFTLNSSGNDIEQVIPSITTDAFVALTNATEVEPYEGMLVKFENVKLLERGNYGEYVLIDDGSTSNEGAIFNEDIGSTEIGNTNAQSAFNKTVRENKLLTAYGVVAASFGEPKVHPRDENDLVAADGNAFTPILDFSLTGPADSAEIVVDKDLEVTWNASSDFDGDDVTYEWALYTADTTQVIVKVESDNSGSDTKVTLPYATVDALLADAGIANGEKASFVWNVRVSDGSDTLDVRGPYERFGDDFFPIYRHITLEKSLPNSIEDEFGKPTAFRLEQNYPNPFNPSTTIKFALPEASDVKLTVYNMLGQRVNTLINNKMTAGFHSVPFDASNLASGMYIYRIEAAAFTSTKKMMLIK